MELYEYTAAELSAMMEKKECSSREVTESVFDRIEATEPQVKAYLTTQKEEACAQADAVDAKRAAGETLPPLAGIPVGVKDNICTKGLRTTCASHMLENFVPPYHATVVEKLLQQQAVITGKLNMDEFAMGSSTETSYFQKTANPHDIARIPGGSSGGSAAAVAAGSAVVALGSDTGGSIRQPASLCGVVGFKPTYGAVSRFGLVAFASSLDQIGPFGRSVTDAAILYDAICGPDMRDATSVRRKVTPIAPNLKNSVKGLKIGLLTQHFGEGVAPETKNAVLTAAKTLEAAGAVVKEVSVPSVDYSLSAYYIIASAEASSNLARFDGVKYGYRSENFHNLTEMYENTRSEGFGEEVKRRILLGTFVLSSGYYDAYYKRAKLLQQQMTQEFDDVFSECDLLLTPTTPDTAFLAGEKTSDPLQMYACDICTVPVNIAGLPAISVPCGFDSKNLPIGMQLIGPHFSEELLLNTAYSYETLSGGFCRIPEMTPKGGVQ